MSDTSAQTEVLNYVEESLAAIEALENEKVALKQANAALEARHKDLEAANVRLEKVAAEKPVFKFSEELVTKTLDKLANLTYIGENDKEDMRDVLTNDPSSIFQLLSKVAEASIMAPSGAAIDKIASISPEQSGPDPHGWGDAVSPSKS